MITLGLVADVDADGIYVTLPGSRGVLRGPYKALSTVAAGTTVLVSSTDDGEQVVVGPVDGGEGVYSVRAFGAVGDGVADDTAAIQSAIDAAADGGIVHFPPGDYACTGALTIPETVRLRGTTIEHGSPGGRTRLRFSTDADGFVAITCGSYVIIENLIVRGTYTYAHTTTGIAGASVTLNGVSVGGFDRGVALTNAYYATATRCEFTRNAQHLRLFGCYNVNLYGCSFVDDSAYGYGDSNGIVIDTIRSLNMFGGSIEGYKIGITVGSGGVHLYGVYFETGAEGNMNAFGVNAGASDGVNVVMSGCTIYLNAHDYFLYIADGSTNATVTAHGNLFCSGASSDSGIAYGLGSDTSNAFYLSGDNWDGVADAAASYVDSYLSGGPPANSHIELPAAYTSGPYGSAGAKYVFEGRDLFLGGKVGFYNTAPVAKPTITGSRGGNAALASLLTQLATLGLITDSST